MSQASVLRTGEPQFSSLSRFRRPSSTQLALNSNSRDETRKDSVVSRSLTRATALYKCRTQHIRRVAAIVALLLIVLKVHFVGLPQGLGRKQIPGPVGPNPGDGPWLFGLVADLDKESVRTSRDATNEGFTRSDAKSTHWVSTYKRGQFRLMKDDRLALNWIDESDLVGNESHHGRGMELSDLIWFHGKLLTPDDRVGALYEIVSPSGGLAGKYTAGRDFVGDSLPHVRKIVHLNVSLRNAAQEPRGPFKAEWMVVKDGRLLVGGHGREMTKAGDGRAVVSRQPMFVVSVGGKWEVHSRNWTVQYNALRKVAGVPFPGYLMHEAWLWSSMRREWIILPRRISAAPYDAHDVERKGAKIVFIANEDFSAVRRLEVSGLPEADALRGFSAAAFVPGSREQWVAALRTIEVDGTGAERKKERVTRTYLSVFDLRHLDAKKLVFPETEISTLKFEGLAFL